MGELSTFCKTTASGISFDYANPQASMINLHDTVHHLSRESRWGNNIHFVSYTVAQHSMIVAGACKIQASRPYALLHDAAHAYTRDLPTPFKLWLVSRGADVIALEHRILDATFEAFGLPKPTADITADVDQADQRALSTEWRDVVAGKNDDWQPSAPPLRETIRFRPQPKVEEEFFVALSNALAPFRARRMAGVA